MRRITLKDVAADAGLSVSCTARALKGRPGFPASTCARVRKIADKLGYRPDPMLMALAAYRQSRKPVSFQGTLAFLTTRFDEKTWLADPEGGELLRGARQRAESLGYRMDYFNLGKSRKSHQRVGKILQSRGICGALIRSFPVALEELHLPFEKFTCIDLFSKPHLQKLPTVSSYHTQSMELVLQQLLQRGYRHPALILRNNLSDYLHHGWQMAFTAYVSRFTQTSTYIHDGELANPVALMRWAKKRKVDVLIYCGNEYLSHHLLDEKYVSIGRMGVVCMDLFNPRGEVAGIYQNRFWGGAVAVEWLQSMLITAQVGIVHRPTALMIPGVWQEGRSLNSRLPLRNRKNHLSPGSGLNYTFR